MAFGLDFPFYFHLLVFVFSLFNAARLGVSEYDNYQSTEHNQSMSGHGWWNKDPRRGTPVPFLETGCPLSTDIKLKHLIDLNSPDGVFLTSNCYSLQIMFFFSLMYPGCRDANVTLHTYLPYTMKVLNKNHVKSRSLSIAQWTWIQWTSVGQTHPLDPLHKTFSLAVADKKKIEKSDVSSSSLFPWNWRTEHNLKAT